MPWHISKDNEGCPDSKPWAVVKDDDGTIAGCHETEAAAKAQLAALYAGDKHSIMMRSSERGVTVKDDGLTFEGYITVFNEDEVIRDWVGEYTEAVAPGAFKRTLEQRGPDRVRMQFDHGYDQLFGGLPIGTWQDIHEDAHGLWGEGRIHDTWHTIPIRAAIESGAVRGQSFRFRVLGKRDELDEDGNIVHRDLTEVSLLEAGPVVWPAYEATTAGLRGMAMASALDEWRAIVRGQPLPARAYGPSGRGRLASPGAGQPDLTTSGGAPGADRPVPVTSGQTGVITTLAERRRRVLALRGISGTTGEAAGAAS